MNLFIDITKLPNWKKEYVSWVDIMGTKNIFQKTDKSPTIYILKLHKAINQIISSLSACSYSYYPLIDGFYFTSPDKDSLVSSLKRLFLKIAKEFMNEKDSGYKFMIRAGLSYGDVIHGSDIDIAELGINEGEKKMLLFGRPLMDTATVEHDLPPFSIGIHENAKQEFSDISIREKLVWFNSKNFNKSEFREKVVNYYAWLEKHPEWVECPEKKQQQHLLGFTEMMAVCSGSD